MGRHKVGVVQGTPCKDGPVLALEIAVYKLLSFLLVTCLSSTAECQVIEDHIL